MTAEIAAPPLVNGSDANTNNNRHTKHIAAVATLPPTYATAAREYFDRGWQPLPLFGGKGITPPGTTGYAGALVSTEDVARWSKSSGVEGLTLRLVGCVGLDVDAYDADKHADKLWAALVDKLGPLPETWLSSSRVGEDDYDGLSGIRLYRLPSEYLPREHEAVWRGNLGPGIDIVRFGHRQVNSWPTVHKRGTRYTWLDQATGELVDGPLPARPEDLPVLPEAWAAELLKPEHPQADKQVTAQRARPKTLPTEQRAAAESWWTPGDPCPAVTKALDGILDALPDNRHDTAVPGMLRLTRLGEQGHRGVLAAITELRDAFIAELDGDPSRTEPPEDEWSRAEAGIYAQLVAQGFTPDQDKGCCGTQALSFAVDMTREHMFFSATPGLAHIRRAAEARMLEPWAVFGAVLARVIAEVPPWVVLPATIGAAASLNTAVLLVGDSSGGKSAAFSCAGEVLPGTTAKLVGAPTGEGLVQSFLTWDKTDKRNVLVDDPRALMFVDEIGQLDAVMSRQGATLGSTFRSAISGAKLGNQNADVTRRRDLAAHSYRLAAVCGAQPHLTGVLLRQDEVDAGTPQRWLFLRAKPATLPNVEPEWPGALAWKPPEFTRTPGLVFAEVALPDEVKAYVKAQRRAAVLEDVSAVDGHLVLTRLKVATALAWLHGERDVSMQWWDLAGLVVDESCAVRDACSKVLSLARAEEDRAKGHGDARRAAGAREAAMEACDSNAELLAATVAKGAHPNAKHGPDKGCTRRCFTRALRNRKGADRECAINRALDLGWIEEAADGHFFKGESWPA